MDSDLPVRPEDSTVADSSIAPIEANRNSTDELPQVDGASDAVPSATPEPAPQVRRERLGVRWGLIFGVILIGIITLLVMFNSGEEHLVSINYLFGETPPIPVSVVIMATAAVAVIIDELAGSVFRASRRRRNRKS